MTVDNEEQQRIDVSLLAQPELDALNQDQVAYVREAFLRKRNPRIYECVSKVLEGQIQAIIESLSREPFAYVTPDIELQPGVRVRLRSLYSFQTRDVQERTQEFLRTHRTSDVMGAQHMAQLFLAHGIDLLNGEPLGGFQVPDGVWNLDDEQIRKAMDNLIPKRMRALDTRPQAFVSALISANQIFQEFYDDVVNLRGNDKAEITGRAEKLVSAVGKSTGPQVAGQKQT